MIAPPRSNRAEAPGAGRPCARADGWPGSAPKPRQRPPHEAAMCTYIISARHMYPARVSPPSDRARTVFPSKALGVLGHVELFSSHPQFAALRCAPRRAVRHALELIPKRRIHPIQLAKESGPGERLTRFHHHGRAPLAGNFSCLSQIGRLS
jgi:hypothetical protein